ncbi:MAG: His/Gly/Thr/Pro-type tRNA ligase C-terminal domain-containing protein, partial [Halobacteria archaeon]|nr:His/Gly/Thr/Pro-type tRNA ligase C-terminal domain-containing protein [Halobacteria archaeon]
PTQVRFVPIGEEHVEYCDDIADELAEAGIRAEIDDRDDSVGKKIANAEKDWVPYIAVVGDDEVDSGELSVRIRAEDKEVDMTLDGLIERIDDEVGEMPRAEAYMPRLMSRHPQFE